MSTRRGVDAGWWKPLAARHQDSGVALTVGSDVIETGLGVRDVAVEVDLPDGTRSSLSINSLPSRGADGAVNGLVLSFRDTTERRRQDRALRETGDRLREAHEVAMLASWQWDPDTDEVLVFHTPDGPGPESGSRTPLEELLRRAPADTRAAMRAEIAAFENGQRDESVRRFAEPSSSGPRWLEIRSRAVRDADGRLECIRGTSQDVTAQELAKGEVTGARDFLQATLDSLPAQIAVLGAQGDLVMTNRAWVQFGTANGGSACSAAQGNYLAACDSARGDRWADRAAAGVRALICGAESAFSLEYPCHGPEDERWFLMRAARFEGPGDARVVIAHDDVTARHLAESQVATQAALLDEVDVAVVATDLAGRVTYANHGAERLYGWTPAEAVGRSVRDLVAPSERPRTEGVVAELRRVGRWEGQLLLERKDGTTFPAYVRERLMGDGDGRPAGTIGVSVDMTERVASERALLAARKPSARRDRQHGRRALHPRQRRQARLHERGCRAAPRMAARRPSRTGHARGHPGAPARRQRACVRGVPHRPGPRARPDGA
jgi:PAS domain S-box-containing protein